MASLGKWRYTCDRAATAEVYARAALGYSSRCACNGRRNFVAARTEVFPPAFLSLLTTLGIDPAKDGEVYHNGRISAGKHHYGGWFHFIGTLDESGDFPPVELGTGFTVHLCHKSAPSLEELKGLPLVQLEFAAASVPWRLSEPEAD